MKYLLLILSLFVMFSCNNDDNDSPHVNTNTEHIYKIYDNYTIIDQKYYKGVDGKEYPLEADSFFKKQWSFYNDPSIITVQLKNDSIIINENLSIQKFKYVNIENNLFIKKNDKNIILAHLDPINKALKIYKNYQTCLIINDENTNETFYKKESQFGKILYQDVFPLLIPSPSYLRNKDEFIFWTNIEYSFKKG